MTYEFNKGRRVEKTQEFKLETKSEIVHDCKIDYKKKILEYLKGNQKETIHQCPEFKEELPKFYDKENKSEMFHESTTEAVKETLKVYDLYEERDTIEHHIDRDSKNFKGCYEDNEGNMTQDSAKEYQTETAQEYDLEDERTMIEEYIENDVSSSCADRAAGEILLTEPDHLQWHGVSMGGIQSEISTDSGKALVYLCKYCNVMFENELTIKSHSCIAPSSFKSNVLSDYVTRPTNSNNSEDLITVVDELTITCDDTNNLFKKQLRTKRNVYKIPKKQEANSVRSRNDKGPHICHICNKSLSRRSSLLIHMRRHTGEMPYECEFCERKFVVQYDLDRHMTQHAPEKKYSFHCARCRKPFVSKSGLLQHYDQQHKRNKFCSCDICGQYFSTKTKLIKHKVEHEAVLKTSSPSNVKLLLLY